MTDRLYAVAAPRTERMCARDGTVLVADIWQPEGDGPFPVLLMRQAYGRRIGTSLCYAPPEWYAARGYIVVMQDARGRGESGGTFDLFRYEAQDGVDTVNWAAGLPGSSGRVGMFGFSFQGTNQLLAATQDCPALRALAPAMIGWDLRRDWAYENDAFPLRANLGWAIQLAAETARLAGDHAAQATLFAASRGMSFSGSTPVRPPILDLLRRYSHYTTWLDTPADDPYWASISPAAHVDAIIASKPAVFLIGGWYDSHLPGTLAAWRALSGHVPARLLVGPWGHFPWDRRTGDLDFGNDAITDIDQQQVRWFDQWLKDRPPATPDAPVRLFDMGAHVWRDGADLPEPQAMFHLSGTGRAAIDTRDGGLVPAGQIRPDADVPQSLTLDPWRPAPAQGGSFGMPVGPVDRSRTDARSDIATFTTPSLTAPHLLCGQVMCRFVVRSAHPSFDLHAVLSRISAAGQAYTLAEGYARAGPGETTVPMRATCARVEAGEALRLSVSLSCFPAFPLNPGTGVAPCDAALPDMTVTTVHIVTGDGGTCLHLPLSPAGE
ncbi:CocE/NonD family hydrolase [Komagataeibacter oboediens]|uniref:CocE/NonD family hydrolase n=1 Tax=Komagataeibacter oboediens TaxID=65958 RepID=A0ABS5SPB0_9PROT|nr:CocE/NonD family hydrolase [Komagataeibacter oboediens]MBL7232677.1 CocE/NonD family hydrolase [Komagataeibacter oboediens]MBT0676051.1 CocE/NonD family hydrolase [Komagataeibacter oboediens]MBT0679614.1 CocE/NonD family hydrolase [Komagataeibacter oboediens]MBV1824016.1 CocE/NonD family hydrolase [Komagataeibacter oboediens]